MGGEEKGCVTALITVAVMIVVVIAYMNGFSHGVDVEQKRAIEAAVGRYAVDPKTGEASFLYGCSHAR